MSAEGRRVALVTGATRGIGALIAAGLAAQGWDLTISARTREALTATAEALRETGAVVECAVADMAHEEQVREVVAVHEARFDRLDALVLNAGMGAIGPFADFPLRRLDKLLAVNVRASYQLVQELLPLLRRTGTSSARGARVIAVSSMTGLSPEPLNSAYGATKAALVSLCGTLSTEEFAHGVSGTAVCPGYVATDMTSGLHETVAAVDMLPAEDVAELVVSLTRLSRASVVPVLPLARSGPHLWQA